MKMWTGACLLFSWECTSEQTNKQRIRPPLLLYAFHRTQKPSPATAAAVAAAAAATPRRHHGLNNSIITSSASAATGAPTSLRVNRPFVYTYNEILSIPLLMLAFNISIWLIFSRSNWKRERARERERGGRKESSPEQNKYTHIPHIWNLIALAAKYTAYM